MGSPKSHVEFYLDLFRDLICSDPLDVLTSKSLQRDLNTVVSRTRAEGISFLTKTLPSLGKAVDAGLESSSFSIPRGFKPAKGGGVPAFMQGYLKLIFDSTGRLLDEADPRAVKHVRQVCFFVYKLELPYRLQDERRVIDAFLATESELSLTGSEDAEAIMAAASYIARDVLSDFEPKDIVPGHGPGAVATGERLDEKWNFSRLFVGIHQVYPYYEYFMLGKGRELLDRLGWYRHMQRLESGTAKVVLVPKDSRGPRLISCEPLEYQWVQQGLGRKLVSHLETHRATRGQVNFSHQEVNRRLALESSKTKEYATLDLKEASDRVSTELVKGVFRHTTLLRYLLGTRTTATTLPDGRRVELKKFAPMGSALCFPVEAFCFWLLIVAGLSRDTGSLPSEIGKHVFVYGDDIIVPTVHAQRVVQILEMFALRVNVSKSCIQGSFRESCGMDAFKGVQVTPTRCKKVWTARRTDGAAYASYVALANSLQREGYQRCSDTLWSRLEEVYGRIPFGTETSPFPCRIVQRPETAIAGNRGLFRTRWSLQYQRFEFYVIRTTVRRVATQLDNWQRLLRDTVSQRLFDPDSNVVPRSLKIKRGWAPV